MLFDEQAMPAITLVPAPSPGRPRPWPLLVAQFRATRGDCAVARFGVHRIVRFALLAFFASLSVATASAADRAAPIAPFHAEYTTARNGDVLGRTVLELVDNRDGTWTLSSDTRGTEGLAGLLGIELKETSRLRWTATGPQSIAYEYRQGGIKQRHRTMHFDADARLVHVEDDKGKREYAWQPGTIERNLVSLALGAELASGERSMSFAVAGKRDITQQRYAVRGTESIEVPAGTWDSVRVERTDAGKDTTSWFAKSIGWLPVRIEQTDDGATMTLELASFTRDR